MTMSTPPIVSGHSTADEELINATRQALSKYDPVRMWGDAVLIDARGSTVVISGSVRSRSAKVTTGKLAREVKGVSAVENNLWVDADLELAVAAALAADPRTQPAFPGILVGVVFGFVYLKGLVKTPEIKTAAGEIASKVPGVRAVSNELTTPQVTGTQATQGVKPETAARTA